MLLWLAKNSATILISIALTAVVTLIIIYIIRKRRKGRSCCGCNCAGCPMSGSCHPKK